MKILFILRKMDSLEGFNFEMNMETGYFLCTNSKYKKQCGEHFYDIYHKIICEQIKNNHILNVNGLIRWIDACGYYLDNKLLFTYALEHGTIEMFIMIYYICLFWINDNDSRKYLDYDKITDYFSRVKSAVCNEFLIVNEANYVPKEVVLLIMYDLLCTKVIDINLKQNLLSIIYTTYGDLKCPYNDDEDDQNKYNDFESRLRTILISYGIDMDKINTDFYDKYGKQYEKMAY